MTRWGVARNAISALAVAAIVASCGGSDGGGSDGDAAPDAAETATDSGGSSEPATVTDESSSGEAADEDSDATAETPKCDAIFSLAEIETFFAEPAELTEETDASPGLLMCTWASIEDSEELEDLGFKTLVVQFYSGGPIQATTLFDPTLFETVTTIEGIGDLAYTADSLGPSFFFVDEPVGGALSYTEMAMGSDAPQLNTADDVEQLFRTFHGRVT